ncbi:MAG TPA: DoxX family protein [Gammaproteobacteria bacterium]|nr:DoxX family protein [Gammaproteobacteria bacterium]
MRDIVNVVARVLMAQIFVLAGLDKLQHYHAMQQYMDVHGLSGHLLPLVILLELGGGLALVVGFLTRWMALALGAFCLLTAYFFHLHPGDQAQMINFMKNITMAGGFLFVAMVGGGRLSMDRVLGWKL